MQLVAGDQSGRLVRVDGEGGHERRRMVRRNGHLEGDPVDQREASLFSANALRESHAQDRPHQLFLSSSSISGNTSRAAFFPMKMSRWLYRGTTCGAYCPWPLALKKS